MTEQTQSEIANEEQVHADSLRFKVAHCERALARLKDENAKLKEKIADLGVSLEQSYKEKILLTDRISKKELQFARLLNEKQALQRTIEVRTQRHLVQQQQNLTKNQRDILEMKIRQAQERILQSKLQTEKAVKQCHNLLIQIQRQKEEKAFLRKQLEFISSKQKQSSQMVVQMDNLYSQKLQILQVENRELKLNMENLILDLKLHQRKQELQGLLTYQDNIGTATNPRVKNTHSKSYLTATENKSELPYAQTFRERDCRCFQLEEELIDYEEMVQLLKQRNQRLETELQTFKRRCVNLQSIICSNGANFPKKN